LKCKHAPIIAEVKVASPSSCAIMEEADVGEIALAMERGGAIALSVITEPMFFRGSLEAFLEVRRRVQLPLLMKDIIVSGAQLEAARALGADAVLFIQTLFKRGYCEDDVNAMIAEAHSKGLEVLLEAHTQSEFESAVKTEADLVGINNRDLGTLSVELEVTRSILLACPTNGKLVVSESGIKTPEDIRFLREAGAQAFLVGSAIVYAKYVEGKVEELASA